MRYAFAIALLLGMPSPASAKEWVRGTMPYMPDSYAFELRLSPSVRCFVGKLPNGAVMFNIWEQKTSENLVKVGDRRIRYQYVHFDEGVIDARTGKLREYNLGVVIFPPYGNNIPREREGSPNFTHTCIRLATKVPFRYIRDAIIRFIALPEHEKE